MVKVFFQTNNSLVSTLVATFESEQLYIACLPILEKEAEKLNCFITETITT